MVARIFLVKARPYAIVQPHLNKQKTSIVRPYILGRNLKLLNLDNVNTVQKLQKEGVNMQHSFIINNGKVKRVTSYNQLLLDRQTANTLRSFLLNYYPSVNGWYHSEMNRFIKNTGGGGTQGEEVLVYSPIERHVRGRAAQGSPLANISNSHGQPSVKRPSPKQPSVQRPSPQQRSLKHQKAIRKITL